MKKIFVFLVLLFVPSFVNATELPTFFEKYNLQPSCFKEYASFSLSGNSGAKINIGQRKNLIFVAGIDDLFWKVFDYGKGVDVDYKVLSLSGASKEAEKNVRYFKDGNVATSFSFNSYSKEPKEILIDAGKTLKVNSFSFKLNYTGNFRPVFYIAKNTEWKDADNFFSVKADQVENFLDWRYLKIVFEKYNKDDKENEDLAIQELSIVENDDITYLVKSKSNSNVDVYADYRCAEPANLQRAINEIDRQTSRETFAVDAKTRVYNITLSENDNFNKDFDGDTRDNDYDNCPFVSNRDQSDVDGDWVGDACDLDNEKKNFGEVDSDKDGIGDSLDNCPYVVNATQLDSNADKTGDACADDDHDGIVGYKDNCKDIANANQKDINVNGVGDACEFDKDKDGVFDSLDNCLSQANPDQKDADSDAIGDSCDNCNLYNPQQIDANNDGQGDTCEADAKYKVDNDEDKDGILNAIDNCRKAANPQQEDGDKDGVGDLCDNCRDLQNTDQKDDNKNNVGDFCEDVDADGVTGYLDNCQYQANAKQEDKDNDGVGDVCEDNDADGVLALNDNCPLVSNKDQSDVDGDKIGDVCDQKDNRLIESNKTFFIGFIVFIALIFLGLIGFMVKKMREDKIA